MRIMQIIPGCRCQTQLTLHAVTIKNLRCWQPLRIREVVTLCKAQTFNFFNQRDSPPTQELHVRGINI